MGVKRSERLVVGVAFFAVSVLMVLISVGVGTILTPENSAWENARAGVVISMGMLIAYPFLKRRS